LLNDNVTNDGEVFQAPTAVFVLRSEKEKKESL